MITVNVEVKNKFWFKKIQNPQKYIKEKVKKISNIIFFFKKTNVTFTILLTNSLEMKKLNKKFRSLNKATDVLSFPFYSPSNLKLVNKKNLYIGDIAISYEIINSRKKKNNFFLEFDKVWVHGVLHLIGYDHIKNKDYLKMNKIEKKIINKISNENI